jgi:hypothetical protein
MRTTLMLVIAAVASGCATHFTGAPKVTNGPAGCKATCDGWQMDLVGMVKMGEYSDGCICQVRPVLAPSKPPPPAPGDGPTSDASVPERGGLSGLPAVAGVYVQMQAAAAAAAQQSAQSAAHQRAGHGAPGRPFGPYPGRF